MKTESGISLGTNLGDRLANLRRAFELLSSVNGAKAVAGGAVYETEPVGVPEEFSDLNFLNTVLIFEVSIDVDAWSGKIHAIEDAMLRKRGPTRNSPRIIDLDLLYFGDIIRTEPHLHLPHPQCTLRKFVCKPLSDVRPDLVLPGQTMSIAEILNRLPERPWVSYFSQPLI